MDRFPEKLKQSRKNAEMNQTELSELVGVSRRSITAYESGISIPRKNMIRKLAAALNVTEAYLTDDTTDDPDANRKVEDHINSAREQFGSKGAREASELLERNRAFFAAGGEIDQEAKDALFEALMEVYLDSKQRAREKFSAKSKQKGT